MFFQLHLWRHAGFFCKPDHAYCYRFFVPFPNQVSLTFCSLFRSSFLGNENTVAKERKTLALGCSGPRILVRASYTNETSLTEKPTRTKDNESLRKHRYWFEKMKHNVKFVIINYLVFFPFLLHQSSWNLTSFHDHNTLIKSYRCIIDSFDSLILFSVFLLSFPLSFSSTDPFWQMIIRLLTNFFRPWRPSLHDDHQSLLDQNKRAFRQHGVKETSIFLVIHDGLPFLPTPNSEPHVVINQQKIFIPEK